MGHNIARRPLEAAHGRGISRRGPSPFAFVPDSQPSDIPLELRPPRRVGPHPQAQNRHSGFLQSELPEAIRPHYPPTSAFVPDSQIQQQDMVAVRASTGGDNRKLEPEHFGLIVDWLEIPGNFQMLHGSGNRTDPSTRHTSKKTTYHIMLPQLHARGFPKFVSNGDNLGKRIVRYMAKYKEAENLKKSIGSGLTDHDIRLGLTFQQKLDKICPHFERLHALYGERPNVRPPALASVGYPGGVPEFIETPTPMVAEEDSQFPEQDLELLRENERE